MRRWLISFGAAFVLAALALGARAGLENIEFPIAALGNCESKDACFAYCEAPENQAACFEFARANDLMDEEEIEIARQVEYGGGGPGGCESEDECRALCDDPANAEQCLDFADEHELVAPEKQVVVRELIAGNGPGGCRSEEECRTYCEDPAHIEECIAFADKHGLIDEKDAKITQAVATRGGPGGCFNEESCRAYCDEPDHLEECVDFAVEHDFMSEEEAERVLATGGEGPGGCRGRECETYCDDSAHALECVEFGVARGFISEKEAELALTVARDGGPGGCRGESECRAYCDGPDHGQECFEFGVAHGLIPPEEAARVQKMINQEGPGGCRGRACEAYCDDSEHGEECLQFAIENDLIPPGEIERARKGLEFSNRGGPGGCRGREACDAYCSEPDNQEECFNFAVDNDLIPEEKRAAVEEFKAREGELTKLVEKQGGPGDCRSKQKCMVYCGDPVNQAECNSFATQHGFTPPGPVRSADQDFSSSEGLMSPTEFVGPGGCKSPQECAEYCQNNQEECARWRPPTATPTSEMVEKQPEGNREDGLGEGGPGGCRGPTECTRYCALPAHRRECEKTSRLMSPPRTEEDPKRPDEEFQERSAGPGGCSSPRECFEYCKAHEDECQSFGNKEEDSRPAPCPIMPELECSDGERKVYRREGMCPVAECRPIEESRRQRENRSEEQGEDRGEQSFGRPRPETPQSFEEVPLEFEGPGGCKTPQECAEFCANDPEACGVGGPASGEEGQFGEMPSFLEGERGEFPMQPEFVPGNEPREEFIPRRDFNRGEFSPPSEFVPKQEFRGEEEFRSNEEFRPSEGFQPMEEFRGESSPPAGGFMPQRDFAPQGDFVPPSEFSPPSIEAQFFSANNISCDSGLNCLSACLAVANMRECRQMVKWYLMAKL